MGHGAAAAGALYVVATRSTRASRTVAAAAPRPALVPSTSSATSAKGGFRARALERLFGACLTGDTPGWPKERDARTVHDPRGHAAATSGRRHAAESEQLFASIADMSGCAAQRPPCGQGVLRWRSDARRCIDAEPRLDRVEPGGRQLDGAFSTTGAPRSSPPPGGAASSAADRPGADVARRSRRARRVSSDAFAAWALAVGGRGVTALQSLRGSREGGSPEDAYPRRGRRRRHFGGTGRAARAAGRGRRAWPVGFRHLGLGTGKGIAATYAGDTRPRIDAVSRIVRARARRASASRLVHAHWLFPWVSSHAQPGNPRSPARGYGSRERARCRARAPISTSALGSSCASSSLARRPRMVPVTLP